MIRSATRIALWPLPVAIATALVVAVHLALWLSIRDGHVAGCVPYLEGCTSISRAARHGLGNPLFRLLVLPATALVAMHWWLAARWSGHRPRLVAVLGGFAALALAVYATFLGTEGDAYRLLRRNGVVAFFGASFLAQLVFLRAPRLRTAHAPVLRLMRAICVAMLALGVVHVVVLAIAGGSAFQDRFENALEWWLGVGLVGWYAAMAWLWRRDRYGLAIAAAEPPGGR